MSANNVLGAFGAGEILPALGKDWNVTPPTLRTKGWFEAWMIKEARVRLEKSKPLLTPPEFRRDWKRQTAAEVRGDFDWGSELFFDVIASDAGGLHVLYLLLKQSHEEMTPELAREIAADAKDLTTWCVQAALHKGNPDLFLPPGDRPGKAEAGAPDAKTA